MKKNKLFLMFALLLVGAITIAQEVNADLRLYYNSSVFNETKNAYAGTVAVNVSYRGMSATNMTFEIRRTYNETSFYRVANVGNTTANQTNWNYNFNTALFTDGVYLINVTAWQNDSMGNTIISNVTYWTWHVDNSVPSATIASHVDGTQYSGSTQTFWLTSRAVTNCTLTLWYNNQYTYLSNTSTATSNAGTPTPRSCTIDAPNLPNQPITAYFLSNDQANSTQGAEVRINLGGGSGGGSLTQQQTQLFQNTGSTTTTEGSGSAVVLILIVIALIYFLKKKKR